MFKGESLHATKLAEHAASANLNPRQSSYLEKLWRELQAIQGGLKAPILEKNYDLAMIRRIRAKQEEIKEFLRTKDMGEYEKEIEEQRTAIRKMLIEWTIEEVGIGNVGGDAADWVDENFQIEDDGNITAKGDLIIRDTMSLLKLPDNLIVNGNLDLSGCENFQVLPDNLSVGGCLDLTRCNLKSLPKKLTVGSYLMLLGCNNLTDLPDSLNIKDIYLDAWSALLSRAYELKRLGKISGFVRDVQ